MAPILKLVLPVFEFEKNVSDRNFKVVLISKISQCQPQATWMDNTYELLIIKYICSKSTTSGDSKWCLQIPSITSG